MPFYIRYVLPFCLVFLTVGLYAQKYPLKSAEGKMSVVFPGAFETEKTENDEIKIIKMSATVGEQTFFASYSVHSLALTDRESLAKISLESFIETTGGTLTSNKSWKLKGEKGIIAEIELAEQAARLIYQVILIGSIQYQIVVVAPNEAWNQKSANRFVKSFKVQK